MEPYYIQNLFHFLKDDQDPDQVSDPTKLGQAFGSGSDSAGEIPLQPFFLLSNLLAGAFVVSRR